MLHSAGDTPSPTLDFTEREHPLPYSQPPPGVPVGHLQAGSQHFQVSKHLENVPGDTSGPSPGGNRAQISYADTRIQKVMSNTRFDDDAAVQDLV